MFLKLGRMSKNMFLKLGRMSKNINMNQKNNLKYLKHIINPHINKM